MRSIGTGLANPVARAGDRFGSGGEVGSIEHFAFSPGDGWLPADGRLVPWTAQLAKALHPSFDTFEAGASGLFSNVRDIAYGNGFFAIADNTTVKFTADGMSWQSASVSSDFLRSLAYGNGRWAALDNAGAVWTSTNLTVWTKASTFATSPVPVEINFVAGLWIASIFGTTTNAYATSTDLVTWTARALPLSINWQRGFSDGEIMALVGAGTLAATRDGINWNVRQNGSTIPSQPWVADGLVMAGFSDSQMAVSDDVCATVSYVPAGSIIAPSYFKVGDELVGLSTGATRALRLVEPWRNASIFGNSEKRVAVGGGRILVFDTATTYQRSTLLRTPLRPRRPGAVLAEKPYVKVA